MSQKYIPFFPVTLNVIIFDGRGGEREYGGGMESSIRNGLRTSSLLMSMLVVVVENEE